MSNEDLITTNEAAKLLGVSASTIYRMEKNGLIKPFRTPGGQRRFSRTALEDYLERSIDISAPQNPSSFKDQDEQKGQLKLFDLPPRAPMVSTSIQTKIWSHRHIPEDTELDGYFEDIENQDNGEVHPKNTLNELPGKEWVRFQSSWFLFNALPQDLKEERMVTELADHHPATFSPTMAADFILFFTKPGQIVLDPFVGIGSTLVACDRTGRRGIGIELSSKYADIARIRTDQTVINSDAQKIAEIGLPMIDYCITSPPYWNVLNRSTKDFHKVREKNGYDLKYSNEELDIGNIEDYDEFIRAIFNIFSQIYKILKNKGYITIVVKNVKKGGKLYPLAWDLAKTLGELYVIKDEKIWVQDKVRLAPYGYPHAWVSNIHHHYCLILRKEEQLSS